MSESDASTLVVRSEEELTIHDGGRIRMAGGTFVPESGTQPTAIADVTTGPGDVDENAAAINAILVALRGASIIAT